MGQPAPRLPPALSAGSTTSDVQLALHVRHATSGVPPSTSVLHQRDTTSDVQLARPSDLLEILAHVPPAGPSSSSGYDPSIARLSSPGSELADSQSDELPLHSTRFLNLGAGPAYRQVYPFREPVGVAKPAAKPTTKPSAISTGHTAARGEACIQRRW